MVEKRRWNYCVVGETKGFFKRFIFVALKRLLQKLLTRHCHLHFNCSNKTFKCSVSSFLLL